MDEQINMSAFSYDELNRLVRLIPQTDPTTHAYGMLLESIERYGAMLGNVDWILNLPDPRTKQPEIVQFNPPVAEDEKFDEPAPVEEEQVEEVAPSYTADEVRKAIQKARMDGKISSAKGWIQENFGADGFSALPASKYNAVMEKLKELG